MNAITFFLRLFTAVVSYIKVERAFSIGSKAKIGATYSGELCRGITPRVKQKGGECQTDHLKHCYAKLAAMLLPSENITLPCAAHRSAGDHHCVPDHPC